MWLDASMQLLPGEEREVDHDRPKWLELRVEIYVVMHFRDQSATNDESQP